MDGRVTSIADKLIEKVVIRLGDGTEWPILMNFSILMEFEKMTGLNALADAEKIFGRMSATNLCILLFLSLKEQGAKYTLEDVAKLAHGSGSATINGLQLAFMNSMVRKDDAATIELLSGELRAAS